MAPAEPAMIGDDEIVDGLIHCHQQTNKLAEQIFEAAAQISAVTSILHERGLLTDEELAAHRQVEEQRLTALFQQKNVGVQLEDRYGDKYAIPQDALPPIDCASRLHLCHAACCALRFRLTVQDVREGVMRWDLGGPYLNRQEQDGYCAHLDRAGRHCGIYAHRPAICRVYDCRNDERIWLDFEQAIINPALFEHDDDGVHRPSFPKREAEAADCAAPEMTEGSGWC